MSSQQEQKKHAAEAALQYISNGMIIGIGTGSTVNYFIDALAAVKGKIEGAVPSSIASEKKLKELHIPIVDLNSVNEVHLYVDGADEFNPYLSLIKGGGGALTREKIIANAAKQFVCIVDESKRVQRLGAFPVPIEVIPMARSYVARQLVKLGGDPVYREGFVTDNGNVILDVHCLEILKPIEMESRINNIPGVVTNGIFADRGADVVLMGTDSGVEKLKKIPIITLKNVQE